MSDDDNDGQMIFGDLVGLKLPDICLTSEEKPRKKTSPRKLVPTRDRTRARCVTGAHATDWFTAVGLTNVKSAYLEHFLSGIFISGAEIFPRLFIKSRTSI